MLNFVWIVPIEFKNEYEIYHGDHIFIRYKTSIHLKIEKWNPVLMATLLATNIGIEKIIQRQIKQRHKTSMEKVNTKPHYIMK